MPASMISAPTGGRPKVIGSSIATVAMVPMPGSTPTSVPTSAPIRHSIRLMGVKATPKPRARLWKRSAIVPSLNHETREELERQTECIGKQQAAADGQADADDDGLYPFRLLAAERGDHEAREGVDDEPERTDREGEGNDRQRDEEWSAPVIFLERRPLEDEAHDHDAEAQRQQQTGEHPRRSSGAERESVHALQIARSPQRKQRERHQYDTADKVLRTLDPFRQNGFASLVARRITH